MKIFNRIKNLWSKKPFKPGDRLSCPSCGAIMILVRNQADPIKANTLVTEAIYHDGGVDTLKEQKE